MTNSYYLPSIKPEALSLGTCLKCGDRYYKIVGYDENKYFFNVIEITTGIASDHSEWRSGSGGNITVVDTYCILPENTIGEPISCSYSYENEMLFINKKPVQVISENYSFTKTSLFMDFDPTYVPDYDD